MSKTQIQNAKKKKKELERAEKDKKLQLISIEKQIADYETELVELNEKLCLEEVYSNPEESSKISNEISNIKEKINLLYEEWEELI